jgi:hypothetical protein
MTLMSSLLLEICQDQFEFSGFFLFLFSFYALVFFVWCCAASQANLE